MKDPKGTVQHKPLVKEIKQLTEKFDKHIISECHGFAAIKDLLVKSVALHRKAKDVLGKTDKSEAGEAPSKSKAH